MKFADLEISMRTDLSKVIGEIQAANKKLDDISVNTGKAAAAADKAAQIIERGAVRITQAFTAAGAAVVAFGGFVATKLAFESLDAAAEKVDHLGKVAKQLDIPIRDLSVLRFAAGESGVQFDTLATMAAKASKNLANMVAGGTTVARIGEMRVELTGAAGQMKSISELLPDIAQGIESAGSAGERISIASKIFGKEGGAEFVKFLADGGEFVKNFAEQADRAGKLGVIFTDEQVTKLTAYRDAVGRIEEAWLGLRVAIMTEVAPVLTDLANGLALQMGSIPALVRAASRAVSLSIHGDRAAYTDLAYLGDSLLNTLSVVVKEVSGLAVTTFIEGLKVGLAAIWPTISDGLMDAISMAVKGAGFTLPKSAAGNLEDLRMIKATTDVSQIPRWQAEIDALKKLTPGSGESAASQWARIAELQKRIDDIQDIDRKIAIAAGEVEAVKQMRMSRFARTLEESKKVTEAAFDEAKFNISMAVSGWNQMRENFFQDYLTPAEQGQQAAGFGLGDFFVSLGSQVSAASDRLTEAMPRLTSVLEKLRAKANEIIEFRQGLAVRSLNATGDRVGADRQQLVDSFANQIRDVVAKFHNAGLVEELQRVQEAELAAFDAKQVEGWNKKIEQSVQALKNTYMPMDRLQGDMDELNFLVKAGEIDLEDYLAIYDKLSEKLRKLREEEDTTWNRMGRAVANFSGEAARSFADLAVDGKASFRDLFTSFEKMAIQTLTKAQIFDPLFQLLGSQTRVLFQDWLKPGSPTVVQASGGVWSSGDPVSRFAAGAIVTSPTYFGMRGGRGLMGEAGPEAIMPLTRVGGDLGVRASGLGTVVNVIDARSGGNTPEVSETTGPDGRRTITVLIRDTMRQAFAGGEMDVTMARVYGIRRQGTPR